MLRYFENCINEWISNIVKTIRKTKITITMLLLMLKKILSEPIAPMKADAMILLVIIFLPQIFAVAINKK